MNSVKISALACVLLALTKQGLGLSCYTCTNTGRYCVNYGDLIIKNCTSPEDTCYSFIGSVNVAGKLFTGVTQRGCEVASTLQLLGVTAPAGALPLSINVTDASDPAKPDLAYTGRFFLCKSDNCNTDKVQVTFATRPTTRPTSPTTPSTTTPPPLVCYTCASNREKCLSYDDVIAINCTARQDTCYSFQGSINSSGLMSSGVVRRGCGTIDALVQYKPGPIVADKCSGVVNTIDPATNDMYTGDFCLCKGFLCNSAEILATTTSKPVPVTRKCYFCKKGSTCAEADDLDDKLCQSDDQDACIKFEGDINITSAVVPFIYRGLTRRTCGLTNQFQIHNITKNSCTEVTGLQLEDSTGEIYTGRFCLCDGTLCNSQEITIVSKIMILVALACNIISVFVSVQ